MAIEDRNLATGTELVARYKGHEYKCVVVAGEGDKPGYRMECPDHPDLHRKEFKSISSAGSAVMGGSACNGWRFWSLAGSEEAKPKKAAMKAAKASGNPGFKRLDDGRYFCDSCMEAFDAPKDVTPVGCPKGHRPEDFKES